MKTIKLPFERMSGGLAHFAQASDWDPEVTVWGTAFFTDCGVIDGWYWATDQSTALVERAGEEPDTEFRPVQGRRVVAICEPELPTPVFRMPLKPLALAGGSGRIPLLGDFDLDRLWHAAYWVSGETEDTAAAVLIAADVEGDKQIVRIGSTADGSTRRAVVVGCRFDDWFPTIDLPLDPA